MSGDGSSALLRDTSAYASQTSQSMLRTQVLRFGVVGGASVLVDLLTYTLLYGLLDRVSAKGISYLCGMLLGFIGNKFWTFSSQRRSVSEPAIYVLLYALTLCVNVLLNSAALEFIRDNCQSDRQAQLGAFVLATGVTTALNFAGMKYIAFRKIHA